MTISRLIIIVSWGLWLVAGSLLGQDAPRLLVLGTAQDGGFPQAGCKLDCCRRAWEQPAARRFVSCLAIVDPLSGERWMLDCTPDFREQLQLLDQLAPSDSLQTLHGILPTHAHIGHYAGLLQLGREVMSTTEMPVFCMPRLRYFLETQGPWEQLVRLKQISIKRINAGSKIDLNSRLAITAIPVPHRDEYSETVAFRIDGPRRSALYLPDIDKWERWELRIEALIEQVDVAFLDATFFDGQELPGRDMSEIPHPFIVESVRRFSALPAAERSKIRFIHLNHTNPALEPGSAALQFIEAAAMHVAEQSEAHEL